MLHALEPCDLNSADTSWSAYTVQVAFYLLTYILPLSLPLCRDKLVDLPNEVINALFFLEEFAHYSHMPRRVRTNTQEKMIISLRADLIECNVLIVCNS